MTTLDVIGQVYSEAVKRELSDLAFENKEFAFSCKGFVSGANHSAKRGSFIFFINRALTLRLDIAELGADLEDC